MNVHTIKKKRETFSAVHLAILVDYICLPENCVHPSMWYSSHGFFQLHREGRRAERLVEKPIWTGLNKNLLTLSPAAWWPFCYKRIKVRLTSPSPLSWRSRRSPWLFTLTRIRLESAMSAFEEEEPRQAENWLLLKGSFSPLVNPCFLFSLFFENR